MNEAERLSKLAGRFGKLQADIRKAGLADVADKMAEPSLMLVHYGLEAYNKEYCSEKEEVTKP
jgi:hypothetical protein